MRKTNSLTIISALTILAGEIESPDMVASAALFEGALRITELRELLATCLPSLREQALQSAEAFSVHQKVREELGLQS